VKSASDQIYNFIRKDLKLVASGNDQRAFARNVLAPLIRPGMRVYTELNDDIFGA
jgi:hypothetical protein